MADQAGSEFVDYELFTVEYRDASHRYWIKDARGRTPAVSVTSALKVLEKPALLQWAEAAGATGAAKLARLGELEDVPEHEAINLVRLHGVGMDAKRDAGADRGTAIHEVLQSYATDGTIPSLATFEPEVRGYVSGLCKWLLSARPEPTLVEQIVGSAVHLFAGRLDMRATVRGRDTLVDLKTNPRGRIYAEAHVQAAAYRLALEECVGDAPEQILIVGVGADGSFTEVEGTADGEDFLAVLECHRRLGRIKNTLARERAAA